MTFWDDAEDTEQAPRTRRERPGGWLVIGIVLFLALAVGGAYYATASLNADKVPLGTTVSGVDIGGLSRADARARLADLFDKRAHARLTISVDGSGRASRSVRTTLAELGFSVDYDATLDDAGAVQAWTPQRQWDYFTGGDDVAPVVRVDQRRLEDRLSSLARGLRTPPRDGRVVITRHGVRSVDSEPGQDIDLATAGSTLSEAFVSGARSVRLSVVPTQPDIDDADVHRALEEFANPAMSAAVGLRFGPYAVRLRPEQYGAVLSMVPRDGVLVPHVDTMRLDLLVQGALSRVVPPAHPGPHGSGGRPGQLPSYRRADLATAFLSALTRPEGHREAEVDVQAPRTGGDRKHAQRPASPRGSRHRP